MRRLLAAGLLVFAGGVATAHAAVITFEDQGFVPSPPFNAQPRNGDLTSGGFFFDMAGPNPVYQLANNSAGIDNGTTYLVTEGNPSQVTFSKVGGGPFSLNAFDYAEWQEQGTARQISVTGNLVGGGTATPTPLVLTLDLNSSGPDFQTASFGSNWSNLASVVLVGSGATFGSLNYFAIDNIVVDAAAVPEPATLGLLGLACASVFARRRRR